MTLHLLKTKWAIAVLGIALLIAGLRCRYTLTLVWGESMAPTFAHADLLVVDRWSYRSADLERGDVIVARSRRDLLVKRVAGLPGEQVEMRAGILFINGADFPEPHTTPAKVLDIESGQLSSNRYALVGDNRSLTTRDLVHAVVGKEDVLGRVLFGVRLNSLRIIRPG